MKTTSLPVVKERNNRPSTSSTPFKMNLRNYKSSLTDQELTEIIKDEEISPCKMNSICMKLNIFFKINIFFQ